MNPIPQVTHCTVVEAGRVRLKFRDGWSGELDLGPALQGPIFGGLNQPAKFREVTVQDGTLVWPNGADICPDVLRYWCEIGRVCSQAELDAHFTALSAAPACLVAEAPAQYKTERRPTKTKKKHHQRDSLIQEKAPFERLKK